MGKKLLYSAKDMDRALRRIALKIVQYAMPNKPLILVGVLSRGWPLAERLQTYVNEEAPELDAKLGMVDITLYRDDKVEAEGNPYLKKTEIPYRVTDSHTILIDDVLFTGRTTRAAIDAVLALGRPARIDLAVMVDRGYRELPIAPSFVGMNVNSDREKAVRVEIKGIDEEDAVYLVSEEAL